MQQAHLQHVPHPHQYLAEIEWLADKVLRASLQCAQFVTGLGGDNDQPAGRP